MVEAMPSDQDGDVSVGLLGGSVRSQRAQRSPIPTRTPCEPTKAAQRNPGRDTRLACTPRAEPLRLCPDTVPQADEGANLAVLRGNHGGRMVSVSVPRLTCRSLAKA